MFQPEQETLDREALARLQLERMRSTLARVRTNAAWAQRLGHAQPGDLKSLGDWRRLPFLTKADLRDAYPLRLACGAAEGYRRVHMSSGISAIPSPRGSVWKGASACDPRCGVVVIAERLTLAPSAIAQLNRAWNGVSPGQTGVSGRIVGERS